MTEGMEQLRRELSRTQAENLQLRQLLLRNTMEKAIQDVAVSEDITSKMTQFYEEPLSPLYMMLLFYDAHPGHGPVRNVTAADPVHGVKCMFASTLERYGQTFFFTPPGCVACLLNVSQGVPCDDLDVLAGQIQAALADILANATQDVETTHICLSRISDCSDGPRGLYRGACVAAEHRTAQSGSVSGEWEIPDVAYMERPNIYQLEMQFWQHLQAQAFYQAAGVLEQIIRSSRFQQGSLDRAQGIVFSRMEVVLQSVGSSTKQDLMRDPDFSGLMLSLTKAANYQALLDIVYDVLALLEDKFYTLTDSRNRKMVSIEQYIGTHFREQGIGAAAISQEFKISTSYLSRIFRADMGMSVVDYIHRLRIAEGKRLLCESTLSVGEIAQTVGFTNHWGFIRVFKRLEGITPGSYRDALTR